MSQPIAAVATITVNLSNNGTSSEETIGPKGQLKRDNTDCNNCETIVDLPGKNR
jgi:hypothetical protein